jgi:FMN-dependent NADH-azoreductase
VWGLDVRIVAREFILVGQNPAFDEFTDPAAQMRLDAESLASVLGRHLLEATGN